jgi:hypothetical protein
MHWTEGIQRSLKVAPLRLCCLSRLDKHQMMRNTASRMSVTTAEMTSDPMQPRRLEKKKNIGR